MHDRMYLEAECYKLRTKSRKSATQSKDFQKTRLRVVGACDTTRHPFMKRLRQSAWPPTNAGRRGFVICTRCAMDEIKDFNGEVAIHFPA